MLGCTDASYIIHDFWKNDFVVGGNVKFFTEMNIMLITTNITIINKKILKLAAFKSIWYMERHLKYISNIWRKVAPHEDPEKQAIQA